MTFTKTPPATPGFYAWRSTIKDPANCCDVLDDGTCFLGGFLNRQYVKELGGEWCRLVPSEEVEKAQRVIREQHAQIIGCYALEAELRNERDRLRKVADELANATRAEFGELNWRLDAYNQLPHVKKNPDIRKAEPGPARATKP
jgi:hypothetical protein